MTLVVSLSTGCSTTKNSEKYPTRKIDRPFTLYEGMTEAVGTLPFRYLKSAEYYDIEQPIPLVIHWSHALSDQFSMIWFILPLGFKWQIANEHNHILGLEFFNHLHSPKVPAMTPYLTFVERWRLDPDWELESRLGLQTTFQFKNGGVDFALAFSSGPRWQIRSNLSLRPFVAILREVNPSVESWNISVGSTLPWNPIKQVEVRFRYLQSIYGERGARVQGPTAAVDLSYFW